MKKLLMLFIALTVVIGLAACDGLSTNDPNENGTTTVDENEVGTQLASSVYMSSSLMTNMDATASSLNFYVSLNYTPQFLAVTEDPVIEERVEQMMMYFDSINVFLDGAPETALDINQTESTMEGYASQVSYEIEGTTYTIYYNVTTAEEDDTIEDGEFTLEGMLEYGTNSFEVTGGTEVEEGELEMWFETADENSGDYVRVEIEKDATEQYFEIDSYLDGKDSYSEIRLEVDGKDGAIEIYFEVDDLDHTYEITKEVDGSNTIYYFEYSVGDDYGSIQLTTYVNSENKEVEHFIVEEGDITYEYKIVDGVKTVIDPDA